MAVKLANNATSTLAAPITDTGTVVTVQIGDAAKFPALGAGEWFPLSVVDSSLNREIMMVTAISGASLTVTRAQEGTIALSFAAGSKCELRATAVVFTSLTTMISDLLTDLQALETSTTEALAGKAASSHTHPTSQVTGLDAALAGKAASSHTHPTSQVTGLDAALASKQDAAALPWAIGSIGTGGPGTYAFAAYTGSDAPPGLYVGGGSLHWGDRNGYGGAIGYGTWACAGQAAIGQTTLWKRVS
jgi:hypothetical protein